MGPLPDRLDRRTIEMILMAGEAGESGLLPPVEDMAWTLRVEVESLADELGALEDAGILSQIDGRWVVTKFAARQAASSSTERVQQHRNRERKDQYDGARFPGPVRSLYGCRQSRLLYHPWEVALRWRRVLPVVLPRLPTLGGNHPHRGVIIFHRVYRPIRVVFPRIHPLQPHVSRE